MRLASLLTVIAAMVALAAASPPASATYKVESARFRVTLAGQQSSNWTLNQSSICGTETGNGKQTFSYHQKHPVTIVFWHYLNHDGLPWVQVLGSTSGIPITGTASRQGTLASTTTNANCRGTPIGPPQAPPAPDCGTKKYNGSIGVSWYRPQDFPAAPGDPVPLGAAVLLDEEQPQLPFFHCPFFGHLVMQRSTNGLFPEKKVFGTGKHFVLKGKSHRVDQDQHVATGVRADTTVSWTMRLTRIG
jgi:hypothetical protein